MTVQISLLHVYKSCSPESQQKLLLYSQLAGMTKTPYPLLDPIMLAPWLAVLNVYSGSLLPEVLVLLAVMVSCVDMKKHQFPVYFLM